MTASPSEPQFDVACLGESMVTFLPSRPGRLADVPAFHRGIGGAESNVACALARSGHTARWISRVGADGFGDHLVGAVAATGVDVTAVQRDAVRPTGIYFKEQLADRTAVLYYRAGSAAAAMSPENVHRRDVWSGRVLHLSGITAALSPDCRALMRTLVGREPGRPLVSYDVNFRPVLWATGDDPWLLAELARGCDIVFVGEDEAQDAWGLPDAAAVRAALPEPAVLVVKQGSAGATAFTGDTAAFVPALRVDVVEPVGAGDAFAAGFLSATLRGLPLADRLRHGHVMAAATLTVPGDLGAPPARAHADALVALDADAWETLRLGPGWTGTWTEKDT
ncbi:sugar kinase [Streptomyces sp. H10-C2]|uniref:sugar kinase n=1 Tax=unclassified Streptomyces TaxID=2593676 RepID=UPI0024BAE784|nr:MULTISPECIES: sugar kinase [unclassified Streptomyces]MDJ0342758.1 sugar kinase [Streptomyces sp. PH10-H1]MDJ0372532.1 sugar kinase [Streptomyces sp. H10-C2]